jgi:hypothetical protein
MYNVLSIFGRLRSRGVCRVVGWREKVGKVEVTPSSLVILLGRFLSKVFPSNWSMQTHSFPPFFEV